MKILQFPLIKIALLFIFGIVLSFYLKPNPIIVIWALFIVVPIYSIIFFYSIKQDFQNNLFGYSTLLISVLVGISTYTLQNDLLNKNHYCNQLKTFDKEHLLEITVQEKLKFSEFNYRFIAKINRFNNKKSFGKLILNIRKDSLNISEIGIGSVLKIKAFLSKNKPIKNPNQFDYGKYLENQNIYAQVYCDLNNVQISSVVNKNIWYHAAVFRNRIITNLDKNGFGKNELAVITALILGQQQDISQETIQDYQLAGAIHVLSVSGLHVGFILYFVGLLLKPFPNTKKWKFNKLIITILCLWVFGFIAGLAPSILRSVVMFSFVAIGRYLGRGVNIYNTLLVSALIILLVKPSFLFDVGFQLSYISLFFIIWLQPLFAGIWRPKNKIIIFFWDIITVSFAAQIGAMGLSIYYFHQFPELFFITNLIILPAMGFILGYGVFIMILAYLDYIPLPLMKILEYSITILNKIIGYIASFEQFILKDISINKTMLCFSYLMIFLIVIYLKKPKFYKLAFALTSIIIFQISILSSKYYYQNQTELVVFNIKKKSIITQRFGQKTIVYCEDSILKTKNINSNIQQYLTGNFSEISSKKAIPNLLFFKNKKILILNNVPINPKSLNPDILLITNSPKLNLERFLRVCQPKIIVADASNFKSYIKIWKSSCQKSKIDFHSTIEKGYFRLN